MPGWIRTFIRNNIVDTVPDEMDLCLSCEKLHCSTVEYRNCSRRIARHAELRAAQAESAARRQEPEKVGH